MVFGHKSSKVVNTDPKARSLPTDWACELMHFETLHAALFMQQDLKIKQTLDAGHL